MPNRKRFVSVLAALVLGAGLAQVAAGQLSSRPAKEWIERLERAERVEGLKVQEIVDRLGLKPGDVVADLGAGAGVFSVPLSKAVGPKGKVYAVEIDKGFLEHIDNKMKAQGVTNVKGVFGEYTDPKLPARDVDVAMFHDVLHHVEKREEYLKNLAPYIKRGGRLAIIELDPVNGGHKDEPALQVSKQQAAAWLAPLGFTPVQEHDQIFDGGKWYVIYQKK